MYVNEKMRSVETIPGMVGGRIKENDFCKCYYMPPVQ
jgi:hypothetical protein